MDPGERRRSAEQAMPRARAPSNASEGDCAAAGVPPSRDPDGLRTALQPTAPHPAPYKIEGRGVQRHRWPHNACRLSNGAARSANELRQRQVEEAVDAKLERPGGNGPTECAQRQHECDKRHERTPASPAPRRGPVDPPHGIATAEHGNRGHGLTSSSVSPNLPDSGAASRVVRPDPGPRPDDTGADGQRRRQRLLGGLGLVLLRLLGGLCLLVHANASNRTRSPRPRCRGEPE